MRLTPVEYSFVIVWWPMGKFQYKKTHSPMEKQTKIGMEVLKMEASRNSNDDSIIVF
jgi:hypothetical protein